MYYVGFPGYEMLTAATNPPLGVPESMYLEAERLSNA
jgi:hypothetical protein